MTKEKKKSGCIGTMFKLIILLFAISIIAALFIPRDEPSPPQAVKPAPIVRAESEAKIPTKTSNELESPAVKPPPFDILAVGNNELPQKTRLLKTTEFIIGERQGNAMVPAGTEVKVISRIEDKIKVSFMDSDLVLSYTETTIDKDVTRLREQRARLEAARRAEAARTRLAKEQAQQEEAARAEAKRRELERHFSSWNGSHNGLVRHIKKSMNDPSSFKHEETRFVQQGNTLLIVTSFRGRNAFGALVKNTVTARADLNGNVLEIISQE